MSKELMYVVITKMHIRLNRLIESNNYDLLNDEVQHYSRRLDKVLICYNKSLERHELNCRFSYNLKAASNF